MGRFPICHGDLSYPHLEGRFGRGLEAPRADHRGSGSMSPGAVAGHSREVGHWLRCHRLHTRLSLTRPSVSPVLPSLHPRVALSQCLRQCTASRPPWLLVFWPHTQALVFDTTAAQSCVSQHH